MIKKIVFCLILLCCISPIAFAENPDNVNESTTNDDINILELKGTSTWSIQHDIPLISINHEPTNKIIDIDNLFIHIGDMPPISPIHKPTYLDQWSN